MKPTLVIAFPGGAYGSYLEWALHTISTDVEVQLPVTTTGTDQGHNHHMLTERPVLDPLTLTNYIDSDRVHAIVRYHPKTQADQQMHKNMLEVVNACSHTVLVYPDNNTEILCVNNYLQKTRKNWWGSQFSKDIDPDLIYNNWPVDKEINIDQIPNWIKREFLSYYLMPSWRDQIEWYFPDHWQHPRSITVTVSELLWDFENTIKRITKFWKVPLTKNIRCLLAPHQEMLKYQLNLGQDSICNNIINSIINNQNAEWNPLPLASQAWIQWRLRVLGYELNCHNLDTFPCNSQKLKSLCALTGD